MHAVLRISASQDWSRVQICLLPEEVVGALAFCGHCRLHRRSVGKWIVQIVELIPIAPSRERSPDKIAKTEVLQKCDSDSRTL